MNPPLEDPWMIPPPLDRGEPHARANPTASGPNSQPQNGMAQSGAAYHASQSAPQTAPEHGAHQFPYGTPQANYGTPQANYGTPQANYGTPQSPYQAQPGPPQYYDPTQTGQFQPGYAPANMAPVDNRQSGYQQPGYHQDLSGEAETKSHVTIYAPGRTKPYLIGGALILLAVFGLSRLLGGGDGNTTVAIDAGAQEAADENTEQAPEELAFDDLAERVDDLETDDDDDIIIIDGDNGYRGGGGGYGYGNGYGYGDGNGNGIIAGDDGTPGIVLDGDTDIQPGDDLVIDTNVEEPTIIDGIEPIEHEFPSCDVVGDDDHDSDGDHDGADGDTPKDDGAEVSLPFIDGFDLDSPASWAPISGAWGLTGQAYQQTEPDTYGNLTELKAKLPASYSAQVEITPLGDTIGGGFMLGQPTPGKRDGAFVVDFSENGTFVRFGHYDAATGDYNYDGGVTTPDGFDPSVAHTLSVKVTADKTLVLLDGEPVGDFGPVEPGRLGLFTSLAASSFDNLKIEAL